MENNKEDEVRKRKRGGRKTRENRKKHFRIHNRFGSGRGTGIGGRFNTGRYVNPFYFCFTYNSKAQLIFNYHKEAEALGKVKVGELESEVEA